LLIHVASLLVEKQQWDCSLDDFGLKFGPKCEQFMSKQPRLTPNLLANGFRASIATVALASVAFANISYAQQTGTKQPSKAAERQELQKNEFDIRKLIFDAEVKFSSMASPTDIATASISSIGQFGGELVLRAMNLLGVNYKFGGNTPDTGFDCSGFVRYVVKEAFGLVLPRRSEDISRAGQSISVDQLLPGDLVFFNTLKKTFSHVGIYVGNNQFVHAPSSGGGVRVESIDKNYWQSRFDGARRIITGESIFNGGSASAGSPSFTPSVTPPTQLNPAAQ
jgi:cell wall-associated NlpC family hydrolase